MSGKRSEFPARGTLVASQQPGGSLDPGGRAKRTTSSTMPRVRASIPDAEYFQAMAELSPDFIGMLSPQGAFLYVNPAGRQMCGIEPSVSLSEMTLADFHPPGDVLSKAHSALSSALKKGTWSGETILIAADGTEIPGHQLLIAHTPVGGHTPLLSTVIRDNRALHELESKLEHAQHLESVGRLAGGIAHDFNNLLTIIENYVDLAREEIPPGSPSIEDLDTALDATARAAALCRQLLSFARRDVIRPRVTDLNQFVSQFAALAGRVVGEHVRLELDLAESPCRVTVDPGQLDQILANLVVNARDAMPDGGHLTISTRLSSGEEEENLEAGAYVELVVSDTGTGMSDAVLAKAFEPFFTTKRAGQGTGLGLSTVYGAVTQNSGWVFVDSALGNGTRFRILWPETQPESRRSKAPSEPPLHAGQECVLVVEDEQMVRVLACRTLRAVGYRVIEAATPAEALELARLHGGEIDLLLSDVVMPGMNGKVLADRIRADRANTPWPHLPVLFMSGYTDRALSEDGVLSPDVALLSKPFNRRQLLARVREVLGGAPESSPAGRSAKSLARGSSH